MGAKLHTQKGNSPNTLKFALQILRQRPLSKVPKFKLSVTRKYSTFDRQEVSSEVAIF